MDDRSSHWHGRPVLVTGGAGFLGGAVVRDLLARGAEVVGLVHDRDAAGEFYRHQLAGRVHVVHGRAEDLFRVHSALAVYEVRAVFHLAPADRGTGAVVEAVRRYDPRTPVVVARPAEDAARPAAPATAPAVPVPLGLARFGGVFGGDRKTDRPVPATILAALAGARPVLPVTGPARDRVFVRDAARACVRLAEALADRPAPGVLDATFRSGWAWTDRDLAAAVRDAIAGHRIQLPAGPAPANPLAWAPAGSADEALAETVNWYRQFLTGRVYAAPPPVPARRAAA